MNALPTHTEEAAERRARHLRMCVELQDLGMNLARAAAREAMRDLTAPIEHRMPATAAEPACRAPDPTTLFTRLSRTVRQAILLEQYIAAGARPLEQQPPQDRPAALSPRTAHRVGRASGRDVLERLEDETMATNFNADAIPQILAAIRADLGIPAPADTPAPFLRQAADRPAPARKTSTQPWLERSRKPPPRPG